MIVNKQFKNYSVSYWHKSGNWKADECGELEVELVPQGTLAERIRAGDQGLEAY